MDKNYLNTYKKWLKKVTDPELLKELKSLENNQSELELRFGSFLEFGTSGLRGIIGAGTNNINFYTVSKVTQAISNYLLKNFHQPSVTIAYDNRKFSYEFAKITASIFSFHNISVNMFQKLTPTPVLSYAIRTLKTTFGVNITSSHNPKEYNGYKAFNSTGCQINAEQALAILAEISGVDEFSVLSDNFEEAVQAGKITLLNEAMENEYIKESLNYVFDYNFNKDNFRVIYTPLSGVGAFSVLKAFELIGLKNVMVPQNQLQPDSNFTTVPKPNPELSEVFSESLKLTKKYDADIIIATDPDCDRVGVMAKHNGRYELLTGDQVGIILLHYILQNKKKQNQLTQHSFFVTSVVSNELTCNIAEHYGVKVYRTLTGFKNIGAKVGECLENNAESLKNKQDVLNSFVFAYEESIGYMVTPLTRDKDGIAPSMLIALIAAKLKQENKTLVHYLQDIYKQFGYALNNNYSLDFVGLEGLHKMKSIVDKLRTHNINEIAGMNVSQKIDYLHSEITKLEPSNFIEFKLENGCKAVVRPSGTEPKLKIYLTSNATDEKEAKKQLQQIYDYINNLLS